MTHLILIAFLGWLISFLGQLPLGSTSITATQIRVNEGLKPALQFTWGVVLVEMMYLRIALSGMDWIYQHPAIYNGIGWVTVLFFFTIGGISLRSAIIQKGEQKSPILNNKLHRFILGVTMCSLNLAQVPFWVLWSGYMLEWKLMQPESLQYNVFTIGGGSGTVSGLLAYIYGGNYLINRLKVSNKTLQIVMGVIFLLAGAAQGWRMFVK